MAMLRPPPGPSPRTVTILRILVVIIALFGLWGFLSQPRAQVRLQGQWRFAEADLPDPRAILLVDSAGRVTMDATRPRDQRPLSFKGYVASVDGASALVRLTEGQSVWDMACARQSEDLLQCRVTIKRDGVVTMTTKQFALTRVAPGPASLVR